MCLCTIISEISSIDIFCIAAYCGLVVNEGGTLAGEDLSAVAERFSAITEGEVSLELREEEEDDDDDCFNWFSLFIRTTICVFSLMMLENTTL